MNCRGCMAICTTSKKPTVPENCAGYIPKTHGDLLRSMSDEDLAHFLEMKAGRFVSFYPTQAKSWLDWLKQLAQE